MIELDTAIRDGRGGSLSYTSARELVPWWILHAHARRGYLVISDTPGRTRGLHPRRPTSTDLDRFVSLTEAGTVAARTGSRAHASAVVRVLSEPPDALTRDELARWSFGLVAPPP